MNSKINGKMTGAFKFLIYVVLILLFSGTAFAHGSGLALNPSFDLRIGMVYSHNTLIGYYLYVRQKPGMESVMLTEPSGYYALRTLEKNRTNGNERRELAGKPVSDVYSRYSIISSSPVPDQHFGKAFKLFIPLKIVYGNPSSACGIVYIDVLKGFMANIRTFDHKYGDPNMGSYQNNVVRISSPGWDDCAPPRPRNDKFVSAYPFYK